MVPSRNPIALIASEAGFSMTDHPSGVEITSVSQKGDRTVRQTVRANVAARISRRWPVIAATAAGIFTVGHAVGGVGGFIEGYKHAVEYFVPPHTSHQNSWTKLNAELREEFLGARDKFEQSGSADFSRAEFAIMHIKKIDDRNSAVWYFDGEIKRIKKSEWFTIKSCVKRDD